MKVFLNLIFLNLFFFQNNNKNILINSYIINCDEIGRCYVSKNDNSTGIYIEPGILPLTPEKNISPQKNVTSIPVSQWDINQKPIGKSILGVLTGSTTKECAGGLNECFNGCCNSGICSDPVGVCVRYANRNRLLILITGFVFLLLVIIYWGTWYAFGVIWNAKPKVLKSENIYIRFAPSKIAIVETEKNSTPRGEGENFKNNKYNYDEKTDREENNNLMAEVHGGQDGQGGKIYEKNSDLLQNKNFELVQRNNFPKENINENIYSSSRSGNNLITQTHKNEIIYEDENNQNFKPEDFEKYSPNINKWMNQGGTNNMDAIPEESFKSSFVTVENDRKKLGESIFRRNKTNTNNTTKEIKKIGNVRNIENNILGTTMERKTREDVFDGLNEEKHLGEHYIGGNSFKKINKNTALIVNSNPVVEVKSNELGNDDVQMNAVRVNSALAKNQQDGRNNQNKNVELIEIDDKGLRTDENLKEGEKKDGDNFYDWMFN
jgi:hypothetical protein